ncbi:MAG TPA: PEGA domain-containing protein [Rectinemataceae bacterium]
MRKIALILVFTALLLPCSSQGRGLSAIAKEAVGDDSFDVGRQVAVIIGIDRYREWPSLRNAVSEAKKIKSILQERYYIDEFLELYDTEANASAIRRLFAKDLPEKLGIKDSLLVFYAGHGYLDASKTGFWIASDGSKDEFSQSGWIPNAQLRNYLGQLRASRILVLADSCFSGDFIDVHRGGSPTVDSQYYRKALKLTARQILTSGASESVPDESEFGRQLINLLERNTEKVLDPYTMYERIKLGVTRTLPLLGTLPGNEQGASFALFLKEDSQGKTGTKPGKRAEQGELAVAVDMDGADVFIDGMAVGTAPNLFQGLPSGKEILVEARKGDYAASAWIVLEPGEVHEISLSLKLLKGNLFFILPGASAYTLTIDGEPFGSLGTGLVKDLGVGRREVELRSPNLYWKGIVEVKAGISSTVRPEPWKVGTILVKAPYDASVLLVAEALASASDQRAVPQEKRFKGEALFEALPCGRYRLEASGPGYETVSTSIDLGAGEKLTIEPWTTGTLEISSDPPGAAIILDGVFVGTSPISLGGLKPGAASIILRREGFEDLYFELEVEAGKTIATSRPMKAKPSPAQFRVGDTVRVKPEIGTPAYQWGSVKPGDVGVVKSLPSSGSEIMIVDFPAQKDWMAKPQEMELVFQTISSPYPSPVDYKPLSRAILAFVKWADKDEEWKNMSDILGSIGKYPKTTETTDPKELERLLQDAGVFLIPEQEEGSRSALEKFGSSVKTVLDSFVRRGGLVVSCAEYGDKSGFLKGAELLDYDLVDRSSDCTLAGSSWLTKGVSQTIPEGDALEPILVKNSAASVLVKTKQGDAAVAWLPRGLGGVVYIGWDYYSPHEDAKIILKNAVVGPVEQPTKAGLTIFKVGDSVRVQANIAEPKYGWGQVKPGEIGIVKSLPEPGSDMMRVDFPSQKDWAAKMGEMEIVLPQTGQASSKGGLAKASPKTRSDFSSDKDYESYIKGVLKVGDRVIALQSFESVKKGWLGTYYGDLDLNPPACVVWDQHSNSVSSVTRYVPIEEKGKVYNVYYYILAPY